PLSGGLDAPLSPPLIRGGREGFETKHATPDWNEPIAIVGMSGVMPGSHNLEEFWDNLVAGRNLVREVPPERWDWREYYGDPTLEANKTNIKWGGFMPEVDKFDAAFFEISPREARLMDPQQRLFLETAWAAIEGAGYRIADLSGMKIGLFVGVASLDYMEMLRQYQVDIQAHTSTGISHAVLVNRVSYLLNLSGPSEPTDTACSSSLVAFHHAIEAIHGGTCDAALVGGVNALLNPTLHISFSKAGMLAEDGKCKTFDASANGYVRGEGVGAVFLKRLRDAERDGDDIRAVIRGSFVNHGGRATSLTAPNPAAQAEVITRAWERSGLDPATVSYVEAHGTGTKLGDPVEINGLKRAFADLYARHGQDAPPANRCGLGSVKSNIGHLETAAGIASVLKVVLALRHGVLPKTLHFQTQNPYIDLGGSPFYLVTETTPWQRPRDARGMEIPRRAGISGFGFGGANAHLVLEEYRHPAAEQVADTADGPVLIVLSARTPARLHEAAARLHAYVAKAAGGGTAERALLARIAHTLQCGREAMEERLAFTAADLDELARKLKRFCEAPESFADGWQGRSEHGGPFDAPVPPDEVEQQAIDAWLAERALIPLADAWCRGAAIAWQRLYSDGRKPRRLSLPTYPFERRAYWFETRKAGAAKTEPESKPAAAPIPMTPTAAASVADASAKTPVMLRKLADIAHVGWVERRETHQEMANQDGFRGYAPPILHEPSVPEPKPAPALAAAVPVAVKSDPPPRRNHPGTRAMSHEVRQKLQHIVVETLYLGDDCDLNKEFVHLGADSVLGVEIIRRINAAFGLAMPSTKLYEFPSIKRLADYVASQLPDPAASSELEPEPEAAPVLETVAPPAPKLELKPTFTPTPPVADVPPVVATPARLAVDVEAFIQPAAPVQSEQPQQHVAEAPIAVIGLAGRFPGARDAEEFWRLLAEGRSGVVEVPPTRWDTAEHYDPTGKADAKTLSKWGGFLDGIDEFDPLFFGIAPAEAELMDPQQRLFLQTAYHALEHAGHTGISAAGSRCGVFVGVGRGDYGQQLIRSRKNLNAYAMMGLNSSILAARIAYWLNLTGPSLALDTACSSALVAIHQACRSIRAGESDMALAGGACVLTTPDTHIMTSKAGMLSPDGLCRPFDAKANGFVPAEGVGVIVLKDLRRALADGDTVHGVILGSGMNQDGRTNGITAPSGASQRQLIREVHERSGLAPGRIGYMETHGTGTPLGDPIEIQALIEAYGDHAGQDCVLGSVKANIGHALEAAGMAGAFKVLLALKHRQFPPQIQFDALNPHISLAGSPFRINTRLEPWESTGPRTAAISSFGFSGTNCHLVMEEAPPSRPAASSAKPAYLFALSGRNTAALRQRIADLGAWLDAEGGRHDLAAISYSLNAGRGHFAARHAVVAGSVAELRSALAAAEGSPNLDTERRGNLGPAMEEFMAHLTHEIADHPGLSTEAYRRKLLAVADLYMQGGEPDWDALHGGAARRRIPLPLYPYALEKYWVPDVGAGFSPRPLPEAWAKAHSHGPDIQVTCRLSERDYDSADHRVGHRTLMPGAALLELARAQGAALTGRRVMALADNAWLSPLELSAEPREVRVEIIPAGDGAEYFIRSGDTLHAQGQLLFLPTATDANPSRLDLAAIQARCRNRVSGGEIYAGFQRAGLAYGPAYRPIQTLWIGENEALAELRLPPGLTQRLDRDGLHPTLLDGALQTVVGLLRENGPDAAPRLPYALERLSLHAPLVDHCYAHAHLNPDGQRYDIGLYSPAGEILVELRGFLLAPPMGRAEAKQLAKNNSLESVGRTSVRPVGLKPDLQRGAMSSGNCFRPTPKSVAESSPRLAFFRPEWAEVGPADGQPWVDGPLLVFMDRAESLGSRAELLAAAGPGPVLIAHSGEAFGWDGSAFTLRPDRPEDYAALVLELQRRGQLPARVLHLWTAPFQVATSGGLDAALVLGTHSVMHFLRALYREQPRSALHCVFAHPHRDDAADFAFEAMGSLLKSFGYECPGFSFRTVDYPGPGLGYRPLLDEFRAGPGTAIRYRDGVRLARRYRAFAAEPANLPLRQGGVYLITGGLGDLGLLVAEQLARSAVGVKLILVGRSAPSRTEALHALEALGAKVMVVTADVSQREQVYALVQQARARFGALHGVIHGAGVIRDATLLNKDATQVEAVWAPKVHGTLFLDEATASDNLDFFVLFSSVAAVLGNAGQCDYAFANHFMDSFAAWRQRHRPGRTLSLNWPLWRDCAQGRDELVRAQYERNLRLQPLDTRAALDALAAALGTDAPQVLVLDQPDAALTGFLAGETAAAQAPAATGRAVSTGTADLLAALKRDVLASIARILKIREDDIRVEDDLSEPGLTSISLTQWNEALRREFRLELQPTFLFGHRTVEAIAEALFERFGAEIGAHYQAALFPAPSASTPLSQRGGEQPSFKSVQDKPFDLAQNRLSQPVLSQPPLAGPALSGVEGRSRSERGLAQADIAIIGLSGRMPGAANLDDFWAKLAQGADLVGEVPPERWDWRAQ
ncbi:SDR family NAD(P)-dependent oxidoreductase, partial [Methylomagnum sp.]